MQTTVTLTMNPTLDKNATIDRVVPERKLRCHALRYEPGGGGINVSRAIQTLGGESQSIYLSGGATGETFATCSMRKISITNRFPSVAGPVKA